MITPLARPATPIIALAFVLLIVATVRAGGEGCRPEPVTSDTPTGIAGCELYGHGTASSWGGPGVARNDCVYPWTACTPIRVTALATGRTIVVTPAMFCDCYTGTPDQRIVDLDPAAVAALGLDLSAGLWPVDVEPLTELPNTAARP